MNISLFYKPSFVWVFSFIFIFVLIMGTPSKASALSMSEVWDGFTSAIVGEKIQAAENAIIYENTGEDVVHNSQNVPILEPINFEEESKNNSLEGATIIEDQALLSGTDFGMGIESISSGGITVYEVKEGDTLSEIAEQFDVSTNTIRWENGFSGSTVRVGQKLNILPVTGVKHIVKSGDTLGKIADKYDADVEDMLVFNGISKTDVLKQGDILFVPNGIIKSVTSSISSSKTTSSSVSVASGYYLKPVSGPITSSYGPRWGVFHYGIDIGVSRGTSVAASASGVVVETVNYCKEGSSNCGGRYGNYIVIEHPNGTRTRYAHLSKVLVSVGQKVSQGKKIALSGNTGRSTGPHLHFQIEKANGSTIRPQF